jgi:hypothetical protein
MLEGPAPPRFAAPGAISGAIQAAIAIAAAPFTDTIVQALVFGINSARPRRTLGEEMGQVMFEALRRWTSIPRSRRRDDAMRSPSQPRCSLANGSG